MRQRVVAVAGPTGAGKARLAVEAARRSGALLLSCDSMKVYRGLDVGTAKPRGEARAGVDWRGLDLVDPWEAFNAGRFRHVFEEVRAEAAAAGRPLLLVGGTMLYLKAATEGGGEPPPSDAAVRARLRARLAQEGSSALHARLRAVDPSFAAKVHPNDARRIVRGLEVYEVSGRPLSSFSFGRFGVVREELDRIVFVVERTRDDMDARIEARVRRMLDRGWVDECRALLANPRGVGTEARQALGYRELFAWLEAGANPERYEACVDSIISATRRFARKQLTWLRKLDDAERLAVAPGEEPVVYVDRVVAALGGRASAAG